MSKKRKQNNGMARQLGGEEVRKLGSSAVDYHADLKEI